MKKLFSKRGIVINPVSALIICGAVVLISGASFHTVGLGKKVDRIVPVEDTSAYIGTVKGTVFQF